MGAGPYAAPIWDAGATVNLYKEQNFISHNLEIGKVMIKVPVVLFVCFMEVRIAKLCGA